MSYIQQVPLDEATGLVGKLYEAASGRAGSVPHIVQLMSLQDRALQGSMQFYVSLMKSPNALDAARREMIAAVVSNANDCYY